MRTPDVELVEIAGATRMRVRVSPRAARDAIVGVRAGALKLTVSAAPEKGKANRAVIELLAEALGVPASSIEIVQGLRSKDKTVLLPLPPSAVSERLRRARGE